MTYLLEDERRTQLTHVSQAFPLSVESAQGFKSELSLRPLDKLNQNHQTILANPRQMNSHCQKLSVVSYQLAYLWHKVTHTLLNNITLI